MKVTMGEIHEQATYPFNNGETEQIASHMTAITYTSTRPNTSNSELNGSPINAHHMQNGLSSTPGCDVNSSTSVPVQGSPRISPVDQNQLRVQLMRQIEYYLSRENLNHDTYLVSQMDSDQYVDISIIASFNQVKKLTSDLDFIVDVLKESQCVQIDETGKKVRPLNKRSVVILREIPEDTTQQEIEEIFAHSDCPDFVSCEQASASCWYIDFDSEEEAQKAFHYINDTLKNFKGQRIMARIKAKPSPSMPTSRPDQRPEGNNALLHAPDPRTPAAAATSIRYPVPLQHLPLQPTTYIVPTSGQFPYMQSYLMSTPLLPWSFYPEMVYDVNSYYQQSLSSARLNGGQQHNMGRSHGDRRNHSRANSATSEHSESSGTTNSGGSSQVKPTSNHPNYHHHHGHNHHSRSGFSQSGSRNGGDKPSNRNRTGGYNSNTSSTEQHFYQTEIPPRHRDGNGGGYRAAQKRLNSTGHSAVGSYQQVSNGGQSVRRSASVNNNRNSSSTSNSQNPSTVSSSTNNQVSDVQTDKSKEAPGKVGHADQDSKQASKSHHGVQRKSKSPEKEIEIRPIESFELDSSAFPALPGANSTASNAVNNSKLSSSSDAASSPEEVDASDAPVTSNAAKSAADTNENATSSDTPAKLSDIVRNKAPETTLSDIVKGSNRTAAAAVSVTSSKDVSSQHAHQSLRSHASKAAGSHHHHNPSVDKSRPTQLNGHVHHHGAIDGPHSPTQKQYLKAKRHPSTPANSPPGVPNTKSKTASTTTEASNVGVSNGSSNGSKETNSVNNKTHSGASVSPTDQKISYAAMAQRTQTSSTANKTTANQEGVTVTPTLPTSPSSSSSSSSPPGDTNNNGESKADNLYSTTAGRTAGSMSHGPKKSQSTSTQSQGHNSNSRSAKSKNTTQRPASSSAPSNQTGNVTHSSNTHQSSTVIAS